jgi:hypothetical protein
MLLLFLNKWCTQKVYVLNFIFRWLYKTFGIQNSYASKGGYFVEETGSGFGEGCGQSEK